MKSEVGRLEKKEVAKSFRCTAAEAEMLRQKAEKMKIAESEYIRREVFKNRKVRLPADVKELLKDLKYQNLKIGNNINQVVRSCNSKKHVTRSDYKAIVDEMIKLEDAYDKIYQKLIEKMEATSGENK